MAVVVVVVVVTGARNRVCNKFPAKIVCTRFDFSFRVPFVGTFARRDGGGAGAGSVAATAAAAAVGRASAVFIPNRRFFLSRACKPNLICVPLRAHPSARSP